MMMKKDNDVMRDNLEFLMSGGDPKKLEQEQFEKLIGVSPDKFKTPHADNVFDMHSEFQSDSAGIRNFTNNQDSSVQLRKSKPDMVPTKENAENLAASPAQAAPVTPPKMQEKEFVYDVKEIIETAKRTRRDSFEKIKQMDTLRKPKMMGAGLINDDSADDMEENVSEAKKMAQQTSINYLNNKK